MATATLNAARRDLNLKPKFDFDRANYKKSFSWGCGVGRGVLGGQVGAVLNYHRNGGEHFA